jgi:hypothetical protein
MDNNESKKNFLQKLIKRLTGESRLEKNVAWFFALLCLLTAIGTNFSEFPAPGGFGDLIRDGATHSALLFLIAAKLSEIRYHLLPETRTD